MKKDIIQTSIAICTLVGIVVTGMAYFAKADDLKLVELRLDQKIVSDQIQQTQQRMWMLEDRNGGKTCSTWPESDRAEYRELQLRMDDLKTRQQQLIKRN